MSVLAVFRGRTNTLSFYNRLKSLGVRCSVVPTPNEASVGCGLSVEFPYAALFRARQAAKPYGSTFYGFFKKEEKFGRVLIVRLP